MSLKNMIRSLKKMSLKYKRKSKKSKLRSKKRSRKRSSPKIYDGVINVDTNYTPYAFGCRVPKSFI